jgi:hypothetical protein
MFHRSRSHDDRKRYFVAHIGDVESHSTLGTVITSGARYLLFLRLERRLEEQQIRCILSGMKAKREGFSATSPERKNLKSKRESHG